MAVVNTSMLRGPLQAAVAFNDRAYFSDNDAIFTDQETAADVPIPPWRPAEDDFR